MKVALIVGAFPAASQTFVLNQIVGLIQRGYDVEINASEPASIPANIHADVGSFRLLDLTEYRPLMPSPWIARTKSALVRITRWGWRHPFVALDSLNFVRYGRGAINLALVHDWLPAWKIAKDYDVIHCHFGDNGQRAVVMRELGALRGPILTTFHGCDANYWPLVREGGRYKWLFKHGDLFTVGSEFMRKRIVSLGAPEDRIITLPMGIDLSRFRFTERRRAKTEEFRLLTVARLVEVKGIEYVLRALATLKKRYRNLRYLVVGDGPLREHLKALTRELGVGEIVTFVGTCSQEETALMYQASHGFILAGVVTESGEEEGQAVVLAEAQASGLPVIATAVGGLPESMRAGKSGLLVPPRNPEALASAIEWLVEHPEECLQMGYAGRVFVEGKFDLEKLNNQLADIYSHLKERPSRLRRKASTLNVAQRN